jgi:predicted nucleic acid-binding protein
LLTDLVVAETLHALESLYEAPRDGVVQHFGRSSHSTRSSAWTRRCYSAIEVCDANRIDFAEAYLVACAESTGVGKIASFDRSIDRVDTIERTEPPAI